MSELRIVPTIKSKVSFRIVGTKTQGIGYRAHIASLAITSGVEFLYVENIPKAGKFERVDIYAGSSEGKEEVLGKFYEKIKKNIPKDAKVSKITPMKNYHSEVTIPLVRDFVALLTAGELSKGIKYISDSGQQAKEGFSNLQIGVEKLDAGVGKLNTNINKGFRSVVKELRKSR